MRFFGAPDRSFAPDKSFGRGFVSFLRALVHDVGLPSRSLVKLSAGGRLDLQPREQLGKVWQSRYIAGRTEAMYRGPH